VEAQKRSHCQNGVELAGEENEARIVWVGRKVSKCVEEFLLDWGRNNEANFG
jgi:hypothetical protein